MNATIDRPTDPEPSSPAPVAAPERIDALDYARGFALFGIVLMNVEWFERPIAGLLNGLPAEYTGIHLWLDRLVEWLIQGKFYPLFSLLFGMGFAVMLQRGEARSGAGGFVAIYLRRLLALFVFGVLHGVLFYPGDILHAYALGGMALLVGYGVVLGMAKLRGGRRLHVRWLAIIPLTLLAGLPLLAGTAFTISGLIQVQPAAPPAATAAKDAEAAKTVPSAVAELAPKDATQNAVKDAAKKDESKSPAERRAEHRARAQKVYDDARKIYQTGSWMEITRLRWQELARQMRLFAGFGMQVVLIFMLGAWFVLSGALRDIAGHRRLFERLAKVGLPLGIVLALAQPIAFTFRDTMPQAWWGLIGGAGQVSVVLMCVGYFALFVLVAQSPVWSKRFAFLPDVGRMALTHYILQSAVLSTLFAAYGLGLHGHLQRGWQILLVVALFALQVAYSRWWMARYRFGPLEWLWRALTYLRLPPMRR